MPILVYAMGVPVQAATGTSLAIVGLNAAAGAIDQWRSGRSLPKTGLAFGISGLVGALGGAWLNHQLRGELILVLFSLLMVAAAIGMLRRGGRQDDGVAFDERYSPAGCCSRTCACLLEQRGFKQVWNTLGGMTAWKEAGLPIVDGAQPWNGHQTPAVRDEGQHQVRRAVAAR